MYRLRASNWGKAVYSDCSIPSEGRTRRFHHTRTVWVIIKMGLLPLVLCCGAAVCGGVMVWV